MTAERLRRYRELKTEWLQRDLTRRREMARLRARLPAFDWESHGGPVGMVLALWRFRRRAQRAFRNGDRTNREVR